MKTSFTNNQDELLAQAIDKKYGDHSPDLVKQNAKSCHRVIMEMFVVTKVRDQFVELTNLFAADDVYAPVLIDESIRRFLKCRSIFLMTLGLKGREWHVLYMSSPYS